MMNNLRIWNEVKQPPADALKTIGGGRLKGMTDIKPQWRVKAMTQIFGPCGTGWKYEVVTMREIPCSTGEVMALVDINLFFKEDDKWSDAIPGTGGSMLVAQEKNGLHVSDEAFKMATTDAISTAMKFLGVAADVYMGMWNGSKYKEPQQDHRFKPGEKEEIYKQVRQALDDADEMALKQIFSEYTDPEEKMKVWAIFSSAERSTLKELLK